MNYFLWLYYALVFLMSPFVLMASTLERGDLCSTYVGALPVTHYPQERLLSDIEHISLLKQEILKAEDHILITSWGLRPQEIITQGLHTLLGESIQRGVNVYIYLGGTYALTPDQQNCLKSISTHASLTDIHTKIFARDNDFVALGSFNWLSPYGEGPLKDRYNENGTIVFRGSVSNNIQQAIWSKIKLFNVWKQGDQSATLKVTSQRDFYRPLPIGSSNEVFLLSTGESHLNFLLTTLEKTKKHVIISSPFVTEEIDAKISDTAILAALKRGVKFTFITRDDENVQKIEKHFVSYFKEYKNSFVILKHPYNHSKTWIFDDEIIVDGSYNIFSAAPKVAHPQFFGWSFNHESGLVISGDSAKNFIEQYYQKTLLGTLLTEDFFLF